ncbi:N-acetyltransferase [Acrasis kona]|uniref:Probable N-acetyltransferase 14 n=1 Tax=Acrasis kona TaxID=1008807 RepID=A0AAW2ZPB1_9EUKA
MSIYTRSYNDSTDREQVMSVFEEGILAGAPKSLLQVPPLFIDAFGGFKIIIFGVILYAILIGSLFHFVHIDSLRFASFSAFTIISGTFLYFVKVSLDALLAAYIKRSKETDLKNIDEHYLKSPSTHFWVAVDSETDQIVGMVAADIKKDEPKIAELRRLSCRSDYRGIGVAKLLLDTLEHFCNEMGYEKVYLVTISLNKPAVRFYEKNGFNRIKDSNYTQIPLYIPVSFPTFEKTIHKKMQ